MFCMNCGNQIPEGSNFCLQCGTKVAQPMQQPMMQMAEPAQPYQQVQTPETVPQYPPMPGAEKTKKGSAKKWIIIAIVSVLVIAAVVAVVLLLGKKDKKNSADEPTDVVVTGQPEPGEGTVTEPSAIPDAPEAQALLKVTARDVLYNAALSDVKVIVYKGYDNVGGEVVTEAGPQAEGEVCLELAPGEYTLWLEAEGYYGEYKNVAVSEGETVYTECMVPEITDNRAFVLIEWDSARDLDLCVFNAQTSQHISIMNALDAEGNFLVGDNGAELGYEAICISDYTTGIYTVYVRDDASLLEGAESIMEAEGLEISVYVQEGKLYERKADSAETAAMWSPLYLYDGAAIDLDEYIYDLSEYPWATRDKNASGNEAAAQIYEAFLHGEEALNDGRYLLDLLPVQEPGYLWNGYVDEIQYAYLDLGADEIPELLVTFVGMDMYAQDDDSTWEYVIRYDGTGLSVCYEFETWARSDTTVSYYGVVHSGGSNGAASHSSSAGVLDAQGQYQELYWLDEEGLVSYFIEPFYSDGFTEVDTLAPDTGLCIYRIGGIYYLSYADYLNEGRASYEEVFDFFSEYGYVIYTQDEIREKLAAYQQELDIELWMLEDLTQPQVQILDTQWYADYAEPDTLEISEEAREDLDDIAYALYETMNYEYGVGEWSRWDIWSYLDENLSQFLFWVYYDDAQFYESREEEMGYYDYSLLDMDAVSGLLREVFAYDYDFSGLARNENDAIGVCYEDGKLLLFFGPVGLGTGTPVFSELYEAERDYSRVWNYVVDIDYEGEVYGQCILALRPTNNAYGYELVGCQIVLN